MKRASKTETVRSDSLVSKIVRRVMKIVALALRKNPLALLMTLQRPHLNNKVVLTKVTLSLLMKKTILSGTALIWLRTHATS